METLNATELLAALGHESRLAVFRMLVEAALNAWRRAQANLGESDGLFALRLFSFPPFFPCHAI